MARVLLNQMRYLCNLSHWLQWMIIMEMAVRINLRSIYCRYL